MLKEEIGKLFDSNKFCSAISCYGDDKLKNVIKEIYYDGMRAGYDLAKFRLELLSAIPFGAVDEYWDNNKENIKTVLDLCKQYEEEIEIKQHVEEVETVNVCQALEEMREEERLEGRREGRREGRLEGRKEGAHENLLQNLDSVIKTLHLTPEQAMDALEVPENMRLEYQSLLDNQT